MKDDSIDASRRALIIIPGTVNYFYNLSGRRIAEALQELGFAVTVSTLGDDPQGEYDWCLLSNIGEILHAHGDESGGLERLRAIGRRCGALASLAIDCVSTPWYPRICDLSSRVGAGWILDLGMHDQGPSLEPADRVNYRFVFSGLTRSERRQLDALGEDDAERPIPWAFVGHATPHRAALVDHLIQSVDPRGFVYMPAAAPYTEKGSPHLNQQQFERVLARTRYQVWCSHHPYFYMEPERFRASLLTGGVPVKIIDSRREVPASAPLTYLMMEPGDVGERLTEQIFPRIRRRYWEDWRRFPTLSQEVAAVLREAGIDTGEYRYRAA
jgi:hypothetical protein